MYVLFVSFMFIFLMVLIKVIFDVKEAFDDVPEYLKHKTSCFSCETEMRRRYGDDGAFLGQPSKLYSAEAQGVAQYGLAGGFIGKTMKYY